MDNWTKWLAGGAIFGSSLGLIATVWSRIKSFFWRIACYYIKHVEFDNSGWASEAMLDYIITHHKLSKSYDRVFRAMYEQIRGGKREFIPTEIFGYRDFLFWNGWFPVLVTKKSGSDEPKATSGESPQITHKNDDITVALKITFLRGTFNVDDIFVKACAERTLKHGDQHESGTRFFIKHVPGEYEKNGKDKSIAGWYHQARFRLLAHKVADLGPRVDESRTALSHLVFPPHVMDLIEEIRRWRNSEKWYKEKGIPWKRGWSLYGVPGTGKTALTRAFAQDLDLPVFVFNLTEMNNRDLTNEWRNMLEHTPCIALFEDIDNVFHGRENVSRRGMGMSMYPGFDMDDDDDPNDSLGRPAGSKKKRRMGGPLTFDCLLNCIDGVERADGVFTIITTNDISKLDEALGKPRKLPDGTVEFISTRPGRIDKAIELTYMTLDCKRQMAKHILGDFPAQHVEMNLFIDKFPDLQETPAQFQERCAQIALKTYWDLKEAEVAKHLAPPTIKNGRYAIAAKPFSNGKWEPLVESGTGCVRGN